MDYVYDSSFVGSLIVPDEKNNRSEKIHAAIGKDEKILIPQLFWYEITNVFKNLLRRKRYPHNEVILFFPEIAALGFTVDYESGIGYCQKLLHLCNDYNISSYDAAYLELAARKKAVLCTLDDNLKLAAKKHGVTAAK